MPRAEAEVTSDYVQIVPCGLLRYQDKVFLFQRKESDPKYRLYGRTTIWQGCHVSKREGVEFAALLKTTILERVSRSLFLSRVFPIDALGYCWDRQDPNSSRHFGVIYQIRIDNPHTAIDLKKKEFKRQRGHGLIGQFDAWQQLVASQDDLTLESWSRSIIDHLSEAT
jgi:predicted NUDIX family phosphoesterase